MFIYVLLHKIVNKVVAVLTRYNKFSADMIRYNVFSVMIYVTLCYVIYIIVTV